MFDPHPRPELDRLVVLRAEWRQKRRRGHGHGPVGGYLPGGAYHGVGVVVSGSEHLQQSAVEVDGHQMPRFQTREHRSRPQSELLGSARYIGGGEMDGRSQLEFDARSYEPT